MTSETRHCDASSQRQYSRPLTKADAGQCGPGDGDGVDDGDGAGDGRAVTGQQPEEHHRAALEFMRSSLNVEVRLEKNRIRPTELEPEKSMALKYVE